jgi:deoxyribose-phosphate aldolase
VAAAVHRVPGALLKVILECGALQRPHTIDGCVLSVLAGVRPRRWSPHRPHALQADFVKTSTGFGYGGAKVEDVALMRAVVGPCCRVKASGGVRSLADARLMLQTGADRIGAGAGGAWWMG